MKKRLIVEVLFCVLFIVLACGYFIFNNSNDKIVLKNEKTPSKMHTNALTMMYETASGSGEYMVSNDSTWPQEGYTFNERLSGCENGSELSWDDERKVVILSTNVSDKCYVYFDKAITFTEYITTQVYTGTDGENGLYYHDGVGSYINADQEAGDNSYRYAGANPNNFVCFGSEEEQCPENNLYRIIGVFDDDKDGNYQIKLIKNTSIGNIAWNSSSNNTWSSASLNTGTLNGTCLSGLGTWASMIAEHDWEVGGMAYSNKNTAKQYYATELENSDGNSITYRAKIGLMYVTDYGYAASGNHWTTELYNYKSATGDNWLYLGSYEWTISRDSSSTDFAFFVSSSGYVYRGVTTPLAVRPSFYLESSVELSGGSGTQTDPYRIA